MGMRKGGFQYGVLTVEGSSESNIATVVMVEIDYKLRVPTVQNITIKVVDVGLVS